MDNQHEPSGIRDIFEDWLGFWLQALHMAFWRIEKGQSLLDRVQAVAIPLAVLASPSLAYLQSIPAWLGWLPFVAFSFFWSPYELWRRERNAATVLRQKLEPSITLTPIVTSFRNGDVLVAGLRVENNGAERIRDCTGRIVSVRAVTDSVSACLDGAQTYLRWSTGDGANRYNTFQIDGAINVARIQQPYVGAAFITAVETGVSEHLNITLREPNRYVLRIEVAAENSPPVIRDFWFYVEPAGRFAEANGSGGWKPTPLPNIVFKQFG